MITDFYFNVTDYLAGYIMIMKRCGSYDTMIISLDIDGLYIAERNIDLDNFVLNGVDLI
jgi:hypothetical protein